MCACCGQKMKGSDWEYAITTKDVAVFMSALPNA